MQYLFYLIVQRTQHNCTHKPAHLDVCRMPNWKLNIKHFIKNSDSFNDHIEQENNESVLPPQVSNICVESESRGRCSPGTMRRVYTSEFPSKPFEKKHPHNPPEPHLKKHKQLKFIKCIIFWPLEVKMSAKWTHVCPSYKYDLSEYGSEQNI